MTTTEPTPTAEQSARLEELRNKLATTTEPVHVWGIKQQIIKLKRLIAEEAQLEEYREQAAESGLAIEVRSWKWRIKRDGRPIADYWPSTRRFAKCGESTTTVTDCGDVLEELKPREPYDDVTMPFGKHQGERIKDLPWTYLKWLSSCKLYGDVREAVDHYCKPSWERSRG